MKWKSDPYWQGALKAALALSPEHRVILTPDEFVGERPAFWPVNEAPAARKYRGDITAFVVPKDWAGRLPPWVLRDGWELRFQCVYANEVFVIYSSLPERVTLAEEMKKHIPAFLEQRERCLEEWKRTPGGEYGLRESLPYVLDTQKNRILQAMFPDHHYATEQFEDLSNVPELLKKAVFKYCVSSVRVEISGFCNRSCGYCPVSFLEKRKDPSAKMPWELFSQIIDELADIHFSGILFLCLYNEPLYDKEQLFKALDYMGGKLPDCFIKLVSNGDYLTKEYFQELGKRRIDEFTVSVHYSGTWNREIQLGRIKDILSRVGIPDTGTLTEDEGRLIYYVNPGAYGGAGIKSMNLRTEDFTEHGVDRAGALPTGVQKIDNLDHCDFPFSQFNVAYDGTVVPCCNICSDVPGAKDWCIGTLKEYGDIFTAYTSPKLAWFRRRLFAPRRDEEYTPEICRTCAVAELDDGTLYRMDDPLRREIDDCWITKRESGASATEGEENAGARKYGK